MPFVLTTWGDWLSHLPPEQLPPSVLQRARIQRTAAVAAMTAGLRSPETPPLLQASRALGKGTSLLPPGIRSLSLPGALFLGAALALAHEEGDSLFLAQPASSAVVTSLLVGAEEGISARESLVAQVAANELMGRMGAACLLGPLTFPLPVWLHRVGAAAAAARCMRLSGGECAHALALALLQPPLGRWQGFGSAGRLALTGEPVVDGYRAALLAKAGVQGPLDALDSPHGAFAALSFHPLRSFLGGLSEVWLTSSLGLQPRPGSPPLQPALAALDEIITSFATDQGRPLGEEDVRSLRVEGCLTLAEMERLLSPPRGGSFRLDPVAVHFSCSRALALRIVRGSLTAQDLTPDALAEVGTAVASLEERVHIHHDWKHTFQQIQALSQGIGLDQALSTIPLAEWGRITRRYREVYGDGLGTVLSEFPRAAMALPPALRARALGAMVQRITAVPESILEASQTAWSAASRLAGRASDWLRTGIMEPVEPPLSRPETLPDHHLANFDLESLGVPFPVHVEVFLKDGRILSAEASRVRGGPGSPPQEVEEVAKERWDREMLPLLGPSTASQWVSFSSEAQDGEFTASLLHSLAEDAGSLPRGRSSQWLRDLGSFQA